LSQLDVTMCPEMIIGLLYPAMIASLVLNLSVESHRTHVDV